MSFLENLDMGTLNILPLSVLILSRLLKLFKRKLKERETNGHLGVAKR